MSFKPYPAYKDSGVDWLGEVPEHWEVKRLRFVVELNPSKSEIGDLDRETVVSFLPMEAIGDDGSLKLDREKTIGEVETGYTYFRDGDVTIAKITPCYENGKGALMHGLVNGIGFGTTELIVARPRPEEVVGTYLHYRFISADFRNRGQSYMYGAGGQKRVPDAFVRDFVSAFPPIFEQRLVTSFLDRETAKIDALMAEQQRLIQLLKEKRQAVISHAVTKGLNPDAPMKDSGIEWLGEVPVHWKMTRLRTLFWPEKRQEQIGKQVLSVYRDYGVILKNSRDDNMNKTPEDLSSYQLVNLNDLVVNKMKAWQGSLGVSELEGITSPDYVVFSPRHSECSAFLHLLLRSQRMVSVYRSISNGIRPAQWRLEPDSFLCLPAFLPPDREQHDLVSFISEQTSRFDNLTTEAQRAIDLLHERRSALISAAVTGQIDVREAAAA
jgi:type I restriction enzyme S subunit